MMLSLDITFVYCLSHTLYAKFGRLVGGCGISLLDNTISEWNVFYEMYFTKCILRDVFNILRKKIPYFSEEAT